MNSKPLPAWTWTDDSMEPRSYGRSHPSIIKKYFSFLLPLPAQPNLQNNEAACSDAGGR